MSMTSNKPYFIRALYDWIVDNNLTPYLLVNTDHPDAKIPQEHTADGRIVLNISPHACRGLTLENHCIAFTARFSGQTTHIAVSPAAVLAIYAQENGRGMEFGPEYDEPFIPFCESTVQTSTASKKGKPVLTLVKDEHGHED